MSKKPRRDPAGKRERKEARARKRRQAMNAPWNVAVDKAITEAGSAVSVFNGVTRTVDESFQVWPPPKDPPWVESARQLAVGLARGAAGRGDVGAILVASDRLREVGLEPSVVFCPKCGGLGWFNFQPVLGWTDQEILEHTWLLLGLTAAYARQTMLPPTYTAAWTAGPPQAPNHPELDITLMVGPIRVPCQACCNGDRYSPPGVLTEQTLREAAQMIRGGGEPWEPLHPESLQIEDDPGHTRGPLRDWDEEPYDGDE